MAVTWKIINIDKVSSEGSLSDVCKTLHWTASDSQTVSGVEHIGSRYGTATLAAADSSNFKAYASITEANAIAWAKAVIGASEVNVIETDIASQITESKTPSITSGIPW